MTLLTEDDLRWIVDLNASEEKIPENISEKIQALWQLATPARFLHNPSHGACFFTVKSATFCLVLFLPFCRCSSSSERPRGRSSRCSAAQFPGSTTSSGCPGEPRRTVGEPSAAPLHQRGGCSSGGDSSGAVSQIGDRVKECPLG